MNKLKLAVFIMSSLFSLSIAVAKDNFPAVEKPVAKGIHAIITPSRGLPNPQNQGWNSNSAFVVTNGGVLMFDSGSSAAIGHAIREVIAGVTDQPVRWIINSHGHGDHWLSNTALEDTVEQIYATEQIATRVVADGQGWVIGFTR